jgi:hypothetical protein
MLVPINHATRHPILVDRSLHVFCCLLRLHSATGKGTLNNYDQSYECQRLAQSHTIYDTKSIHIKYINRNVRRLCIYTAKKLT